MKNATFWIPFALMGVALAGCDQLLTPGARVPSPSFSPVGPGPIVERTADIGHLKAPATASINQPVAIEVWALAGPCSWLGTPSLEVNEAVRTVTVHATSLTSGGICGAIYVGYASTSIAFTPVSTGTYQVKAASFKAIPDSERATKLGADVTPAATLAIEVSHRGSVLADGH